MLVLKGSKETVMFLVSNIAYFLSYLPVELIGLVLSWQMILIEVDETEVISFLFRLILDTEFY